MHHHAIRVLEWIRMTEMGSNQTHWENRLTSVMGPGCVKTWMPRPFAQEMNPGDNSGESLLRRWSASRLNISSRSPKVCFHTAWVRSRSPAPCPFTSAVEGKADVIGRKADMAFRMSAVRGKAEVFAYPSGLPVLARNGLFVGRSQNLKFPRCDR